jgi:hypothetical protein
MPILPCPTLPRRCPQSGAEAIQVRESNLKSHGIALLGSQRFEDGYETAYQIYEQKIARGQKSIFCCHVLNQLPKAGSNQALHNAKRGLSGVYLHVPGETDIAKSALVFQNRVATFAGPVVGIGPAQELHLGERCALVTVYGSKGPNALPQPDIVVSKTILDEGAPPSYQNPPPYAQGSQPL